jgi:hypothetical protein
MWYLRPFSSLVSVSIKLPSRVVGEGKASHWLAIGSRFEVSHVGLPSAVLELPLKGNVRSDRLLGVTKGQVRPSDRRTVSPAAVAGAVLELEELLEVRDRRRVALEAPGPA